MSHILTSTSSAASRYALHLLLAVSSLLIAHGQEKDLAKLPKHLTPVPYAGIRNWAVTQNLGPTGARGWVYGHVVDTNDSREILIKSIEPGSPADGVLRPYDIIVGAAVPPETPACTWSEVPELKPFDADARLSLARAITWAESNAGKGELKLLRHRDGETKPVTIRLEVMGDFADALPMDCPKSQRIVERAAEFLAAQMPADGYEPGVGRPHNPALLLATHDPKYLDHVRRSAIRMSELHTINYEGFETWRWGNTNTFLCEYYLATGDERVLPTIREFCQKLRDGQCNPGTWGHQCVPDYIPPGYGPVNSTGVICFYSLVLAHQCGIHDGDQALLNSIKFFGSYAGRGSIPYGDHPPFNSTTNNGKSGVAALVFHHLGADPIAQWNARLCASSNLKNIEGGHTGNYFNQTWTPLGVQVSGEQNTINFWKRFHSYRDLARRADGSFNTQSMPHVREGHLGTGYVYKGPLWSTGSFALSYLVHSQRLAMLGRRDSVFAENPPAELKPALVAFRAKDFAEAASLATSLKTSPDARVAALATQLEGVAKRNLASIKLTLADMQRNFETHDLHTLKYQLLGIESLMDPADERLASFRAVIDDPANEKVIQCGATYDKALKGLGWAGHKGFDFLVPNGSLPGRPTRDRIQQVVKQGVSPYSSWAEDYLSTHPNPQRKSGESLATVKAGEMHAAGESHSLSASIEVEDPNTIEDLYLCHSMASALRVELNGTCILDITLPRPAPAERPETLLLKPNTRELLKPGANTLRVEFTPAGLGMEVALKRGL